METAKNNGNYSELHVNIKCGDSLRIDWCSEFKTSSFDFVIGNPPYVNPHDMNRATVSFLRANFLPPKREFLTFSMLSLNTLLLT